MSDSRLRIPVSPRNVLIALVPLAALAYISFAVISDFSKIGDIPPPPRPKPKIVPLPGRPPRAAEPPPMRSRAWAGGYGAILERLRPLHPAPERSRPGKRLAVEPDPGQTYARWLEGGPATALGVRRVVYVQPIGAFAPGDRRVLELTAELLGLHFGLPAKLLAPLPVDAAWPKRERRADGSWGPDRLHVPYILEKLLAPRVAADAVAALGLTAHGLWDGDAEAACPGRTEPSARIAIWSTAGNGELGRDADEQEEHLRRAFKTAVQEIGHMLSIEHCAAYPCAMRDARDLAGVDGRPLWLCPECEAKLLAATGVDPVWRAERLAAFYRELEMGEEAWFYDRELYALRGVPGLGETFGRASLRGPQPVCGSE